MKSTNGRSASTNCSRGGEGGSTVTFGRQMSLTWTRAHTAPSPQRGEGGGEGVPTSRPEPPHPSLSPLGRGSSERRGGGLGLWPTVPSTFYREPRGRASRTSC